MKQYQAIVLLAIMFCYGCKKAEPLSGYICYNGNCQISSNPKFLTYSDCQIGCSSGGGGGGGSSSGYNCNNGSCVAVSSNAQYSSYSSCNNSCGNYPKYGSLKVSGRVSCAPINSWYPYMRITLSGVISQTLEWPISNSVDLNNIPVGTVYYHAEDFSCSSKVRDGSVQIVNGQWAYITVNF